MLRPKGQQLERNCSIGHKDTEKKKKLEKLACNFLFADVFKNKVPKALFFVRSFYFSLFYSIILI